MRPGRVVPAVEAAPAVASAAEELLVEHALLGVAAAVASCEQEVGVSAAMARESVPIGLLLWNEQAT